MKYEQHEHTKICETVCIVPLKKRSKTKGIEGSFVKFSRRRRSEKYLYTAVFKFLSYFTALL